MSENPPDGGVAIVTGAGSGIGRAVCVRLAGAGWRLTLVGRKADRLEETVRLLTTDDAGAAERTLIVAADLTEPAAATHVVGATIARWGRIDALVNNAGHASLLPIEAVDEPHLVEAFAVNTLAPARLIAAAWPHWRTQGAGRLVNVSSMATVDPFPGLFAYAGAKAAVESFTRSVMNEGGEHGLRAFSVAPGAVETGMLRGLISADDLPVSMTLDPADVAAVIVDCLEGRRDAEAGTTILVPSPEQP